MLAPVLFGDVVALFATLFLSNCEFLYQDGKVCPGTKSRHFSWTLTMAIRRFFIPPECLGHLEDLKQISQPFHAWSFRVWIPPTLASTQHESYACGHSSLTKNNCWENHSTMSHACFQASYNTPLEHTPGNPPTQLSKDSLYNLLVKV